MEGPDNSPRAISIPQHRESNRMRAERSTSQFTPEVNFPHSPLSAPSLAQSWDLSSYKPGQIKRHAAMNMMDSSLSGPSFTETSSGTSFDSTIDPHMLSYDFSSINTSFTDPMKGPLSEDPASMWKKLSMEEVKRNSNSARKKRSFHAYSEAEETCGPWSHEYLQALPLRQSHGPQQQATIVASNHTWTPSATSHKMDEAQYSYQNTPLLNQEPWATSGDYIFAPSPVQMPAMPMEQSDDIPAFSLAESHFSSSRATTPARTTTVIHSPILALPRSMNLTSDTHTYKKVRPSIRTTLSPEPRSVPLSDTTSPTQPIVSPSRRREADKEPPSSCSICSKIFSRGRDRRRHEDQIHGKKVAAVCTMSATNICGCNKAFKRAEHLRSHLKTVAKRKCAEERIRMDNMMLSQNRQCT
ncbi:hypothetical protein BJ508DRAFT_134395 [Ascobolus immersus RN42]|uniref:C2H2-type domain-containing protein n=1 Tax=Ascobolus immersus RN42 TaxID=1160509 RepID=A0A3N4IK09_ASCIM|nr:hypothetical protein BJ508DRAFT_134395 [Ascobolus immersus RN42]